MTSVSQSLPVRRERARGSFWRLFQPDKPHLHIAETTYADALRRPLPNLPGHDRPETETFSAQSTPTKEPARGPGLPQLDEEEEGPASPSTSSTRRHNDNQHRHPQQQQQGHDDDDAGRVHDDADDDDDDNGGEDDASDAETEAGSTASTCTSGSAVGAATATATTTNPAALRRLVESAYRLPLRLRMHWLAVPSCPLREVSIPAAQLVAAFSHNNFAVARAMCTVDGFLSHQTAKWLLTLLESVGEARSFLASVIRDDIMQERAAPMVFRRNTAATRLVSAYFRLIGHDFLRTVLGPPIQNACNSAPITPVDVRRVGAEGGNGNSEVQRQQQLQSLVAACQDVCDLITHNIVCFPDSLALLTKDLYAMMEEKFPGHGIVVIRSFVFLRLLCPALINPEAFHLLDSKPDDVHHQTLLMMAKLIQCLANFTGSAKNIPLPSAIDSPTVRQFIEHNRSGMATLVQELLARTEDEQPLSCQRIADPHTAALWFCPHCNLVNRSERRDCFRCSTHSTTSTSFLNNHGQHNANQLADSGSDHSVDPRLQGHAPQLGLLDRCAVNLAHVIESKLAQIVRIPDTLAPCTVRLECDTKELFLEASMASLGASTASIASVDRSHAESSHREFDELVLTDDAAPLHRVLDLAPAHEKMAHACMVLVVSRGLGLRFLLARVQRLFSVLTAKGTSACKAFLARWAKAGANVSDYPEAVAVQHCCAAYARITMPSTARQMVAALLENASSHLRSVVAVQGWPSVEVVASLVLKFVTAFFSERSTSLLQQWSPGFVRLVRHSACALESRNPQWAVWFMQGLFARCVLPALVDPRRFGIFDRNVPLSFRRGLHTSACAGLEPRLLLSFLAACRTVAQKGWVVAAHEYHALHSLKGWRSVLGVCRARCRRALLARFRDIFLLAQEGSTGSSASSGTGGVGGSGSGGSSSSTGARSATRGSGDLLLQMQSTLAEAQHQQHQQQQREAEGRSAQDGMRTNNRRKGKRGSTGSKRQQEGKSKEMLVETHTFRLIDPLVIAIYAVTQTHSRIASPLMSPNTHWNDYLELDLWASARSQDGSTTPATSACATPHSAAPAATAAAAASMPSSRSHSTSSASGLPGSARSSATSSTSSPSSAKGIGAQSSPALAVPPPLPENSASAHPHDNAVDGTGGATRADRGRHRQHIRHGHRRRRRRRWSSDAVLQSASSHVDDDDDAGDVGGGSDGVSSRDRWRMMEAGPPSHWGALDAFDVHTHEKLAHVDEDEDENEDGDQVGDGGGDGAQEAQGDEMGEVVAHLGHDVRHGRGDGHSSGDSDNSNAHDAVSLDDEGRGEDMAVLGDGDSAVAVGDSHDVSTDDDTAAGGADCHDDIEEGDE